MNSYHYSQIKRAYDEARTNGLDYVNVKFGDSKHINLPLSIVELILQELERCTSI